MGGHTVTHYGWTIDEVLKKVKEDIENGWKHFQLSPDGELALLNVTSGESHIYKIVDKGAEHEVIVEFEEVKEGNIAMAVTVASRFGRKPEPNEWIGRIHLHT